MTSSTSRPISSHPAFPVVVALWFAALLGGGTFVLPASIFENAASATGLADIVPAAQPPLGDTARLAITVAAAILGALIGLFVAWQVRRATRSEQGSPMADTLARQSTGRNAPDPDAAAASEDSATDDATAWQAWREQMTDEADALDPADTHDPADALERDAAPYVDLTAHEAQDDEPFEDTGFDAASAARTLDEDPQRAEADRLVAGLARLRQVDDEARVSDEAPSIEPMEGPDSDHLAPLSFRDDYDDNDGGAIFDSSFVSAGPTAAGDGPDDEAEPDEETEEKIQPPTLAVPAEPLEVLSLPELVARLELALEARRDGDNETVPRDDDAGFSPRREAGYDDAEKAPSESGETDSQAMLRAALARLDQVERTS